MNNQDLVYHYTSAEAFLGMLKDIKKDTPFPKVLTFLATHLAYMNDPQESKYGEELAKEYIREKETESNCNYDLHVDSNPFYPLLKNMFSISFSAENNSLPMWSMYGKFDGLCLGFDLQKNEDFSNIGNPNTVTRVIYGKDHGIETLYKNIYSLFVTRRNIPSIIKNVAEATLYKALSCYIKHPAYSYEKEYRMIIVNKDIKFRCKNSIIIPYILHKIPVSKLKSIILGPTSRPELIKNSIKMMLDSKGIDIKNINFENSDIPFRVI